MRGSKSSETMQKEKCRYARVHHNQSSSSDKTKSCRGTKSINRNPSRQDEQQTRQKKKIHNKNHKAAISLTHEPTCMILTKNIRWLSCMVVTIFALLYLVLLVYKAKRSKVFSFIYDSPTHIPKV